ncbi:MAG: preprotein translocase subunit SecE [Gammaproteobacteria bacterium]|nr:preprotein translocase subunit SecE [Gammaproteobacteria bacterium]
MAELTENKRSGADMAKLVFAVLFMAAGVFGYYWFSELGFIYRVLMVVGGALIGVAVASTSAQGKELSGFLRSVRSETRRVVWPSRQETLQTTMIVIVLVILVGLFLWLIDSIFSFGFKWVAGV